MQAEKVTREQVIGAAEPAVILGLSMEGADLSGTAMQRIRLGDVDMGGCRFDGCDMRGAELCGCRGCSFRGADLRGAVFELCDLGGADFTGAAIDILTVFDQCGFGEGNPPKGLPQGILALCRAAPPEAREPLPRTGILPIGVAARLIVPPPR